MYPTSRLRHDEELLLAPAALTERSEGPVYCRRRENCITAGADKPGLQPEHFGYIAPGQPHQMINANNRAEPVCVPCWQHYQNKIGTKVRATAVRPRPTMIGNYPSSQSGRAAAVPDPAALRRLNESIKRGGSRSSVAAIGTLNAAGIDTSLSRSSIALVGTRGYTANHHHYETDRQKFLTRAYAPVEPETIRVKFAVHFVEPGRSGSQLFRNFEDMQSMPARSTGPMIKDTCFKLLQRGLIEETQGFQFSASDFKLRGKNGTDYDRFAPDEPLFYHECFGRQGGKAKSAGVPIFLKNKLFEVRLEMSFSLWSAVQRHLEGLEHQFGITGIEDGDGAPLDRYSGRESLPVIATLGGKKSQSSGKRRKPDEARSMSSPPISPPAKRTQRLTKTSAGSNEGAGGNPGLDAIRQALLGSSADLEAAKVPAGIYRVMGLFIMGPTIPFSRLINDRFRISLDWVRAGRMGELTVDERNESLLGKTGSFKTAHPGNLLLHMGQGHGCAGEEDFTWLTQTGGGCQVAVKRWVAKGVRVRKDLEEANLAGEMTNLTWGASLLNLAYEEIRKQNCVGGPTPIPHIPELRFVHCGMFRIGQSKRVNQTMLIEELIGHPTGSSGNFVKYIHNASAVPSVCEGEEGMIARFLSFTQHLQYERTLGMAYVSDYQGWGTLLTDPQIMTSPELEGDLFGGGNVAEAFMAFPAEHICNEYCSYMGLVPLPSEEEEANSRAALEPTGAPGHHTSMDDGPVEPDGHEEYAGGCDETRG